MSDEQATLLAKDTDGIVLYRAGQSITGTVVDRNPSRILLDLPGGWTGIITKKEATGYSNDDDEIDVDAQLEATVIDPENKDGLVMLSLRRASQDTAWAELNTMMEEARIFKVKIEEANKGGLMARYKGLKAFLPVSQLTPLNYPRVEGADAAEILSRLQRHMGREFAVRVLNVDREEGKIIISEKLAHEQQAKETLTNLQVGDVVDGTVSGVVKFGIFVTFGGVEGLVHVSELDWSHVSDPGKHYGVGDKVQVLVIGQDGDKLSFSIKQLTEDPWLKKIEKFETGQTVSGKVTRWNDNGVFIEVEEDVQGLFSLGQFGVETGSDLKMEEGKELSGTITNINTDSHRLELTLAEGQIDAASTTKKKTKKKEEDAEEDSE